MLRDLSFHGLQGSPKKVHDYWGGRVVYRIKGHPNLEILNIATCLEIVSKGETGKCIIDLK